jgi:hypothetical protein
MTLDGVAYATAGIAAGGKLLTSAQLLARPDWWNHAGLLAWSAVRRKYEPTWLAWFVPIGDRCFSSAGTSALLTLGCLSSAGLVFAWWTHLSLTWMIALVVVVDLLTTIRMPFGRTAGDQMSSLTLAALLAGAASGAPRGLEAAVVFVAAESLLAYSTAGILKIRERGWRDGTFVRQVFMTRTYGCGRLASLLRRRPALARGIGLIVVTSEILMPTVLALPAPVAAGVLWAAATAHVFAAVAMGLNVFVWGFAATYPAIFYCGSRLAP